MKRNRDHIDAEESKLSSLLFNKNEKFAEKLKTKDTQNELTERKPIWKDEDDEQYRVNTVIPKLSDSGLYAKKLKQKYETLVGTPSWAKIGEKKEDKGFKSDVVKTVGHLQKKKITKFSKQILEISNHTKIVTNRKTITSTAEFHPKVSAILLGEHTGIVSLYSIEDKPNKLHSFKLGGWQISRAKFNHDGSKAYISSKLKHDYCVYDLVQASNKVIQLPKIVKRAYIFELSPDGKFIAATMGFDEVFILCSKSNELLKSLKNNTNVKSLVFSPDSTQIYCYNEEGYVVVWDLTTYRTVKKFLDNGCINPSRIKISPCGRLLATGTGEGIVNVYETSNLTTSDPIPLKTISHLQTKITNINFNSTSEVLSLASSYYPNAVKLVHIPSYHVFGNFPPQSTNLVQVEMVNFSPNSGYVGISNNKGVVNLFRLRHFRNY
ncbi:U3 small nucleolar RNA-associated protein 18 homolog [Zerene cesonia]|uniref:U3 small nucleolar RNA-associated protein 18 homolog n=1 Tax=Zerene cesonia TaxID=33412 RepID=UPI0018E512A2|nr:U3 small nucleolar RNA-associated protein 18 homolog [Zerene cesonia]